MCFSLDDHPIRLNQEFFLDLAWWQEFFQSWKGCCFLQYPQWAPLPDFEVSSDASGVLDYGAVFQGHWFSGSQSGISRAPTIMSLVRYLSLLAARYSFSFTASPVRGKSNPIADSLSRFQFQRFRRLAPHADSIPTQIPQQLLSDLELRCQINTTSI